jgi:hypothetical protein
MKHRNTAKNYKKTTIILSQMRIILILLLLYKSKEILLGDFSKKIKISKLKIVKMKVFL